MVELVDDEAYWIRFKSTNARPQMGLYYKGRFRLLGSDEYWNVEEVEVVTRKESALKNGDGFES